ncbi:ribbon-helix-helix protein, CopG family [Nocardia heshunensis]
MSEKDFPSSPEETAAFMDRLVFSDEPVPVDEVPPRLESGEDIVVTTSIRLPLQLHAKLKQLAEERNIGVSTLIREWAEAAVAELDGEDQLISLAEAKRALSRVHPIHRAS